MDWEPYVTVVMSVVGSRDDMAKVRSGIVSDFGEHAWKAILMEVRERLSGEISDGKNSVVSAGAYTSGHTYGRVRRRQKKTSKIF